MFNGKAIYNPSGKAGEYAQWACNLYVGCSNNCDYCYCKKGVLSSAMGQPKATLKKCFHDENDAFRVFIKELEKNADSIRKDGGLFFSFSTDPCLPETIDMTMICIMFATGMDIPCTLLTKCTGWTENKSIMVSLMSVKDKVTVGFTLTGMDVMEQGPTVASNEQRIRTMRMLHKLGFKTFASIEPVINTKASLDMILQSVEDCDTYKIGLLSGEKKYEWDDINDFVKKVNSVLAYKNIPVLWKKSVTDFLGFEPASTLSTKKK